MLVVLLLEDLIDLSYYVKLEVAIGRVGSGQFNILEEIGLG
jgi:hypothetical protein